MEEWITLVFTSFITVFQSYQNDDMVLMKDLFSGTPLRPEREPSLAFRTQDR